MNLPGKTVRKTLTTNKYKHSIIDSLLLLNKELVMKQTVKFLGFAAVTVTLPDLAGTITISPNANVTAGIQLTASYSGSETITGYQWKNGDTNVGTNSNRFTPTQVGNYTVTVSATGYNPKTSAAVTVKGWIAVSDSTFGTSNIETITYGNSKFVAAGYDRKVATSTNGTSWSSESLSNTSLGPTYPINAIAYGNNKFVAVGNDGKMAYLSD